MEERSPDDGEFFVIRALKKSYPLPTGILLGIGLILLPVFTIMANNFSTRFTAYGVYLFSSLILIGWVLSFISPRKSHKSTTLKFFGICFAIIAYLIILSTFWSPDPEYEGLGQVNDSLCLAFIFLYFISPAAMTGFWIGVSYDCASAYRIGKYKIMSLIPSIIGYGSFLLLIFRFGIVWAISPLLISVFSIVMATFLYQEKNNIYRPMTLYEMNYRRRDDEDKEREMMKSLKDSGYKD